MWVIVIIFISISYRECNSKDLPIDGNINNVTLVSKTLNRTANSNPLVSKTLNRTANSNPKRRDYNYTSSATIDPPKSFVVVYADAVARLYCSSKIKEVTWMYAKYLNSSTYTPMLQRDRIVIQNGSISIYRTTIHDAGVYTWHIYKELRGLIVLEVINDDIYTVIKNENTEATTNSTQSLGKDLTVFSTWSDWTECSACGMEGRRRRFGMCYVKLMKKSQEGHKEKTQDVLTVSGQYFALLQAFPGGIPCRSRYLPDEIRNLSTVRNKRNEIMITQCMVQCKIDIFKLRSSTGVVLETANNTAGIYSLSQLLPPQPPVPVRNIVFVERGQRLLVKCPGTTLRDIPVTWRVGTQTVNPEVLAASSGGRVRVNARDHILIAYVLYEDSHLYSCWERENLAGTVKLVVWAGEQARWNHHSVLVAMAILGVVLLHICVRML